MLMDCTMISVDELANNLNISKAAVYKSVKKNSNLGKPIIKKDGKTYISPNGVEYLYSIYKTEEEEVIEDKNENIEILSDNAQDTIENVLTFKQAEFVNDNKQESSTNGQSKESITKEVTLNIDLNNEINTEYNTKIDNSTLKNYSIKSRKKALTNTIINKSDSNIEPILNAIKNSSKLENDQSNRVELNEEVVKILKSYVEFLQNECNIKNEQLNTKDTLLMNMQESLQKEQENAAIQASLDEHCRQLDNKLSKLREDLNSRQEKSKKGFFTKIKNIFSK